MTTSAMVFPAESSVQSTRPAKEREAALGFANISIGGARIGKNGLPFLASRKAEAYVHDLYTQAVSKGKEDEFNKWLASAITVSYNSATPTGGVAVNAQDLPEINFL